MIATLMLVAALLVPSVGQPAGCSDVLIIGVRGSGQTGYGLQVGGTVDALVDAIASSGRSVSDVALEYPAISVSDSFGLVLLNGEYDASVRSGVDALRVALAAETVNCRRTDIVLIGYSQGAQVIKQALSGSVPRIRIAAVVLLADPTRDPSQPGVSRLGGSSTERGGSFGRVALAEYLRPVTVDVCAEGDVVCERGRFAIGVHTSGYDDFVALAAGRAAAFVRARMVLNPGLR
jgi:cutinase